MSIQQKLFLPLCLSTLVLISSCAAPKLSQFEVQRPSRITVPREVKKVFIRADLVDETNDKLGIKSKVLQQLTFRFKYDGLLFISIAQQILGKVKFGPGKPFCPGHFRYIIYYG